MTEKDKKRVIDFDFFENLTGDLSAPAAPEVEAVGSRIRALRQEKGVSLEDVSRLTGFEVTFLADVEAGRAQPQLGAMIRLSKALDSAFGRLVSGTGTRLYSITRRHERRTVARSTSAGGSKTAYAYKSLAPDVKGRHMEALMVQLTATAERDVSVHDGEEFIFVLEGRWPWKSAATASSSSPGTAPTTFPRRRISSPRRRGRRRSWPFCTPRPPKTASRAVIRRCAAPCGRCGVLGVRLAPPGLRALADGPRRRFFDAAQGMRRVFGDRRPARGRDPALRSAVRSLRRTILAVLCARTSSK